MDAGVVLGGTIVAVAAALGGAAGFGYALLSTPLLLALGFPLPFVVTANLALSLLSRIAMVYRFWSYINVRRAALLILGSLPGIIIGAHTLATADRRRIKFVTGLLVMGAVVLLFVRRRGVVPRPLPAGALLAGFLGGLLGAMTSLSGVPPMLLLARARAKATSFQADLALYFVVSNGLTLGALAARQAVVAQALYPTVLVWLPGAVAGNWLGATFGTRLPDRVFRAVALSIAFCAGLVTAVTAW